MSLDIKLIILANMALKPVERLFFAKKCSNRFEGRSNSFNSSFLHRSFVNVTVKRYKNWFTFAKVIVKIKVAYFF